MFIELTPPPFAAAQTQPRLTCVASLQLIGHRPVGDLVFLVVLVLSGEDSGNAPGVRRETARAPSRAEDPATKEDRLFPLLCCLFVSTFLLCCFGLFEIRGFENVSGSRTALDVGLVLKIVARSRCDRLYPFHSSAEGARSIGEEGKRRGRVAGCSISLVNAWFLAVRS